MRPKFLVAFMLWICAGLNSSAQVSLTATGGTLSGTYADLSSAFTAINNGTHMGAITIDITASFTDVASAVLNSSGAGSASYTSVLIRPSIDGVVISYASVTGRGVIELNGADNVTIDGDNPGSAGTNRDLTITNTAAAATTLTSVIRVANSAAITSSDNITIMNCNLNGSAVGRNVVGATSTSGSENNTFGIYMGGNGGTTVTTAPSALTSVTTNSAPAGTTINNAVITNNAVNQCARGIVFIGANASVSTGVIITNNMVGDQSTTLSGSVPFTSPSTTVYTKAIYISGTTSVTVTGNTIKNILSYVVTLMTGVELNSAIGSGPITIANNTLTGVCNNNLGSTSAIKTILISNAGGPYLIQNNTITNVQGLFGSFGTGTYPAGIEVSTTAASGTIERNKISKIHNRCVNTLAAYGINLNGGSNVTVQNNFIYDINFDMTGGAAFNTSYDPVGIRINSGSNHKIYYNSVSLFGTYFGTPNTACLSAAFAIVSTTSTGNDVRNNIFSNTLTGAGASSASVCIYLPASGTSTMNLTLNNNVYYSGSVAGESGIAHAGTTYNATPAGPATYAGLYTAANFNPSTTTPTTNLRAYTSVLSAAGTNDNVSSASTAAAPYISTSDLHVNLSSAGAADLDGKAAVIGTIGMDIDLDTRDATTPDIGADEFVLTSCVTAAGGTIAPGTVTVCESTTYNMTATGATTGGGITYQWEISTVGGGVGFSNVTGGSGANTTSYTTGTLSPGVYYYRLNVTCSTGPVTAYSNELAVTVTAGPTGTASGPGTGLTYNPLTYTVTGYPVGASFQWQSATVSGGPYTNIAGATSDTYVNTPNAGGTFYYVVVITDGGCSTTSNQVTTVVSVAGDNVCSAIPISLGINGPYTNEGATLETGEQSPPNGSCTGQASWCEVASHTVWFSFVAPASGRVSLHFLPGDWDSEIAVWSASACGDLLTGAGTMIAANDDSTGSVPYNAYIAPVCLTPGATYYVQVDGYGTTTENDFRLLLQDEGNVAPVISGCPSNITIGANTAGCSAVVTWTAPTANDADNCGTLTFTSSHTSGSTFPPGITTVTYTANDGINASVTCSFDVIVTNDLSGSAVATDASCNGMMDGSIDLTVTGGTASFIYDWDNDGTGDTDDTEDLSALGTGTYTVVITDANDCTDTTMATVNEPAAVEVSTTTSTGTITANSTGATAWQWLDCNNSMLPISGETSASFSPSMNGDYAVIVTEGSCSDTSACVNITGIGVNEILSTSFVVYPNPSNGQFTIEAGTAATLTITNNLGELISTSTLVKGKNQIVLNEIARGTYTLRITDENGNLISVQRLVMMK